ncbi:MAG TPA: NAD(P)H-binding protein [Sphingopyxis sp.]|nr:NAD(P)H-binding protein [Sphingopyxis sp.]
MTAPTTLLVGATGMIGRAVIANAADRRLTIVARRDIDDLPDHHALLVAPPARWADIIAAERPAVLISCLGTTIRQAGSQAAFRAVDHDLILSAARGAKLGGARHMIVVSSVGASARAGNFYLRTKGETEEGLRALDFDRLDLLRPGLLTGAREGPPRMGEGIAALAAPLVNAMLHGSLRRYRSIPGDTVAKAIVALAAQGAPGVHIHENDAIRALAD